jgi:arginyl-tRNA synthetase
MKHLVKQLINQALESLKASGTITEIPKFELMVPKPGFGDFATSIAMVLAKQLKQNPVALAKDLSNKLADLDREQGNNFQIKNEGGFINFSLTNQSLLKVLNNIETKKDQFGSQTGNEDKTVIIEYFQNNVAKPPHIGHLRSAVIGDSLLRIFRFLGYNAISDTHVGDWGTQFGILLYAFKTMGDMKVVEKDPINELNKLYVNISNQIQTNPELHELGKAEFKKLEDGDTENRSLWQWFVRVSMEDFEHYRKLLGLLDFNHNLGESFYEDKMPHVLELLKQKNLVTTGETGELYVDLEPEKMGRCILYKSDGASTYHMRDFATYIYRKEQFNFWKNIYVVDARQSHHFRQLFAVLKKAGFNVEEESEHVDFGFMSLPEGPISTRKGTVISLENLFSEAEKRALAIIEEKNPSLENKKAVAEQVARAAIKYFDLSHNRKTDILFTWEKALSFDGDTGPYIQYTHARIHGILRKIENNPNSEITDQNLLPEEVAVLRKLSQFEDILQRSSVECLPSVICQYLFELSQDFNSFYQNIPVSQEPDSSKRNLRIKLITATAQVISNGLNLLGIDAPEQM